MTRDQFISRIVHDLRGPLRSLGELPGWAIDDLKDAGIDLPPEVAETFDMMVAQASRMGNLVDGLGRYARIERRHPIKTKPLSDVLNAMALPEGVELRLGCKTLPMDAEDLTMVLEELFTNANKHNEALPKVRVTTAEQDGALWLLVEDNGRGIPSDAAERVFEPLTTLRTQDEVEGAGMGLAVVRRIIELYGGQIKALPETDMGGFAVAIRFPSVGAKI